MAVEMPDQLRAIIIGICIGIMGWEAISVQKIKASNILFSCPACGQGCRWNCKSIFSGQQ
jgi:hypothetical protein